MKTTYIIIAAVILLFAAIAFAVWFKKRKDAQKSSSTEKVATDKKPAPTADLPPNAGMVAVSEVVRNTLGIGATANPNSTYPNTATTAGTSATSSGTVSPTTATAVTNPCGIWGDPTKCK